MCTRLKVRDNIVMDGVNGFVCVSISKNNQSVSLEKYLYSGDKHLLYAAFGERGEIFLNGLEWGMKMSSVIIFSFEHGASGRVHSTLRPKSKNPYIKLKKYCYSFYYLMGPCLRPPLHQLILFFFFQFVCIHGCC